MRFSTHDTCLHQARSKPNDWKVKEFKVEKSLFIKKKIELKFTCIYGNGFRFRCCQQSVYFRSKPRRREEAMLLIAPSLPRSPNEHYSTKHGSN